MIHPKYFRSVELNELVDESGFIDLYNLIAYYEFGEKEIIKLVELGVSPNYLCKYQQMDYGFYLDLENIKSYQWYYVKEIFIRMQEAVERGRPKW